MPLSQNEADQLFQMQKEFVDASPLEFTLTTTMDYDRFLRSSDKREEFILTLERGIRKRLRLKFQTRARKIIVLARLDLHGPPHKNPPEAPYKPDQWLNETHLHLYREGFEDRIAYEMTDAPGWTIGQDVNDLQMLEGFFRYCGITDWPQIQMGL